MASYKNYAILVGEAQTGIRSRGSQKQTKFYRHPLVRNDWGTSDKFRGMQGYYFAPGTYKGTPRLYNFSKHPYWSTKIKRPLKLAADGRFTNSSFTVYYDVESWDLANRYKKDVLNNYLGKVATDVVSGDPNFYQYLAGDIGLTKYYSEYYTKKWGKNARFTPAIDIDKPFFDHVAFYRYPSRNKEAFDKSDYNLSVKSYYNYYLDTMPPYEEAVADAGEGIEPALPNRYMMESDIHNTASVNYTSQLTLNNAGEFYTNSELDVWFLEQNQSSPEASKSYFQQYSQALDILSLDGKVAATKEVFETDYKNVVILYPDLDILKKYNVRDDRGTPNDTSDDIKSNSFYPFYNELIIGYDKDDVMGVGGKPNGWSFFTSLFASKLDADHVRSFITMMQLYIVQKITKGETRAVGGLRLDNQSISPQGDRRSSLGVPVSYENSLVCEMNEFIELLLNDELDYFLDVYNESKEEMAEDSNYTILREWEKQELFKLNIKDAIKVAQSAEFEEALDERKRSLQEIFNNEYSPSETLMYIIEKTETREDGSRSPILQTFLISKDVVFSDMIKYIDTQVRYGTKYLYVVKQVRVVFGNEYEYDGLSFSFGDLKIGEGRALGNALGFYPPDDASTVSVNGVALESEYSYMTPNTSQAPSTQQAGHFVFRVSPKEAANHSKILPSSIEQAPQSQLGKYLGAIQKGTADLSGFVIELQSGYGVEGPEDGGMVGQRIDIPADILTISPADLGAADEDEIEAPDNPLPIYRQAINILVADVAGSEPAVDDSVREIVSFFHGLLEDGGSAKVKAYLAQMRDVRDSMTNSVPGAASVGVKDPRSTAAATIYKLVEAKVRQMLVEVTPVIKESDQVATEIPLLVEVLGPPELITQHDASTTFSGVKGFKGLNMRFL